MNTSGLEWFGPPERNIACALKRLRAGLFGMKPSLCCESLGVSRALSPAESVVSCERLPFISQGRRVHGR